MGLCAVQWGPQERRVLERVPSGNDMVPCKSPGSASRKKAVGLSPWLHVGGSSSEQVLFSQGDPAYKGKESH